MAKTKTSKKRKAFSIDKMKPAKLKAGVKTIAHDPDENLRNPEFIECGPNTH